MMQINQQSLLYRINTIMFILNKSQGCSITDLAKKMDMTDEIETIRKDVLFMAGLKEFGINITTTLSPEIVNSGEFDNEIIKMEEIDDTQLYVVLSAKEHDYLDEFVGVNYDAVINALDEYYIMPPLKDISVVSDEYISRLKKYMYRKSVLKIEYVNDNAQTETIVMRPLKIVEYSHERIQYVVTIIDDNIRLIRVDRIKSINSSKEKLAKPDEAILAQLPNLWGTGEGTASKVKFRIEDRGGVISRVKEDLACRKNGKFTKEKDGLYFEDKVIGMDNFTQWIMSYGSALVVTEPKKLIKDIVASAKKQEKIYNTIIKK